MNYEQITYEEVGGILTITLDRPDRLNAFTMKMMGELLDAFDRADSDDDVRVVIMTGRGRAFCAGIDMGGGRDTFAPRKSSTTEEFRDPGGRVALRIFELTKPIIAAINGPAIGVGITMTLPMDVRLASEAAKTGFVFSKRGIAPESCSSWFLPRLVGISRAAEWMYTGRTVAPSEAFEAGLIRQVLPPEELLPAAHKLAREMAERTSPVSVALARQMLWRMLGASHPMASHLAESRALAFMGTAGDAREGVAAFLEKREPIFPLRVSTDLPNVFDESIS